MRLLKRLSGRVVLVAALAAVSLGASGCPALLIPSLAYQGYKYEKNKNAPTEQASTRKSTKRANPQPTVSPSDIE